MPKQSTITEAIEENRPVSLAQLRANERQMRHELDRARTDLRTAQNRNATCEAVARKRVLIEGKTNELLRQAAEQFDEAGWRLEDKLVAWSKEHKVPWWHDETQGGLCRWHSELFHQAARGIGTGTVGVKKPDFPEAAPIPEATMSTLESKVADLEARWTAAREELESYAGPDEKEEPSGYLWNSRSGHSLNGRLYSFGDEIPAGEWQLLDKPLRSKLLRVGQVAQDVDI